jgi:DNA topoisomerase-1
VDAVRLRRSEPDGAGYRRRRSGSGWCYLDADGDLVTDLEIKARLKGLVIPPAWRDVWICPYANGHLQATGVDDAGRRQYLYHEQWRQERDEEKYDRVLELVPMLPEFRVAIESDLKGSGLTCRRVLAGALRMLDRGVFRTGGDEYAEENGSRGVATLLREDVVFDKGDLLFRYTAKGGVERRLRMRDPALGSLIRGLRRVRSEGERLLAWREGRVWHEVRADAVNERFKELTGPEFTAKDLRTWNATVVAAVAFAESDRSGSGRGRKKVEVQVMDQVAEQLGNTRTVARRSYVDPRIVQAFEHGDTITLAIDSDGDRARAEIESAAYRLLTGQR